MGSIYSRTVKIKATRPSSTSRGRKPTLALSRLDSDGVLCEPRSGRASERLWPLHSITQHTEKMRKDSPKNHIPRRVKHPSYSHRTLKDSLSADGGRYSISASFIPKRHHTATRVYPPPNHSSKDSPYSPEMNKKERDRREEKKGAHHPSVEKHHNKKKPVFFSAAPCAPGVLYMV